MNDRNRRIVLDRCRRRLAGYGRRLRVPRDHALREIEGIRVLDQSGAVLETHPDAWALAHRLGLKDLPAMEAN